MQAAFPPNEEERLKALHRLKILDTEPEEAYDDITAIASEIAEAPMAAVTFIDESRQWLKAKVGLDLDETSRDVSFCAHAILNPHRLMVVSDAEQDARFFDNELVTAEDGIRFYAGAPLVTTDGLALGALCVIDTVPRGLSPRQQVALEALSRQVIRLLELREALSEVRILQGLLPICATCKSIQSEDGSWQRMEVFIEEKSEAMFSHGICPQCIAQLYPDYLRPEG